MEKNITSDLLNMGFAYSPYSEPDKIFEITLSDGTKIDNLRINGNNFISKDEIKPSLFNGKLSTVTISDGENSSVYNNLALVQVTQMDDEYWFILREVPVTEIEMARIRSDLDYLAMMANIDI